MSTDNVHLTQAAKDLLGEPDIVRVRAIQPRRWIFYPRAKQALDRLNLLVDHPRGTRMPSVAIYGDSGMGKRMIMEKFCDSNPSRFDPTTGVQAMPVVAIEMTGKPAGERRLYAEILATLGAPQAPRADIVQMEQAALQLMKTVGVQVLVIDEVHNILAGSYREQRLVLNTMRFLSNRLQISLVCFGVIEAREATSGDVQRARRFGELTLNRWAANEQFEALVSSILRNMPLRRPTVLTPKSLRRILQISGGIIANIFHAITTLAAESIESGIEHITDEAVESWRPPVSAETVCV
ncbi:TniB family NTP-binding protein [Mesorhizobium sp. M0674]|uniref:TniB family NTP-binding protein n=1 Tax=unclassified Mesorhizobium TaxID=325217 RepID=UPI00333C7FDB